MSDKPPRVPKQMVDTLFYDASLSEMSNKELFDECMKELYGSTKYDKQGCLIHELMERLERNFEPEPNSTESEEDRGWYGTAPNARETLVSDIFDCAHDGYETAIKWLKSHEKLLIESKNESLKEDVMGLDFVRHVNGTRYVDREEVIKLITNNQ